MTSYFYNSVWVSCEKCKGVGYVFDDSQRLSDGRQPDYTDTPCDECNSSGGHYERIYKTWLESLSCGTNVTTSLPDNSVALVHIVSRPVVFGPGESIGDLTPKQFLDRAIDREATVKRSALVTNIGKECI